MLAVTPYPIENNCILMQYNLSQNAPPISRRVQHTSLLATALMPLPKPYFLRRTPGPDTFNTAKALVKHLLSTASGPQTTRALFTAGTQLERIPGSDTPLRRVVKQGETVKGQHVVRSLS